MNCVKKYHVKNILVTLFLFPLLGFAQTNESQCYERFSTCFANLKPIDFTKQFPNWKDEEICSLSYCIVLYNILDPELKKQVENRIAEITQLLLADNKPIYLLTGMDSGSTAVEKNKDLSDEGGVVYIAIAECIPTLGEHIGEEIVNKITNKFLNDKK